MQFWKDETKQLHWGLHALLKLGSALLLGKGRTYQQRSTKCKGIIIKRSSILWNNRPNQSNCLRQQAAQCHVCTFQTPSPSVKLKTGCLRSEKNKQTARNNTTPGLPHQCGLRSFEPQLRGMTGLRRPCGGTSAPKPEHRLKGARQRRFFSARKEPMDGGLPFPCDWWALIPNHPTNPTNRTSLVTEWFSSSLHAANVL